VSTQTSDVPVPAGGAPVTSDPPAAASRPSRSSRAELADSDFGRLLAFRVALRRFQRWGEDQARAAGLTHVQHQLLVAVKGHPGPVPPTVGDLATYLLLRPHSAVELVDRAATAGLVQREPDPADGRLVRVRLTGAGDQILCDLTRAHLDRLHGLAAVLDDLVNR
jgi:DNA-binding MarR family transcriptional regulator